LVLMVNQTGAIYPAKFVSWLGETSDWCLNDNVWCHTYPYDISIIYTYHFPAEAFNMMKGAAPLSIVCILLKFGVCLALGGLLQALIHASSVGVKQAGLPMKIMGDILTAWARAGFVTPSQLRAWSMARRSLLHNEVAFLLERFDNAMVGFLGVCVGMLFVQALQILIWDAKVPVAINTWVIAWTATAALTTMRSALACHLAQGEHSTSLRLMKETLMSRKEDSTRTCRLIDQMLEGMTCSDYQTKLMYVPLSPTLLKVLMGYFVSVVLLIAGKFMGIG